MAAVIDNKNLPKAFLTFGRFLYYKTFFSSHAVPRDCMAERMQRITMLIITRSSLKRCEYKVTELGIPSSLDNRLHNGLFL